ncbi:MAG TPA: SDR family NAD(P)-dependent oxidoreductase, partial [Pseudonocardiaceae bacterium]|nr:SDR family NAD(P)-dependent oxidoreductase [Pseudonocardiaceae bacterium]
MTGTWIEGPVLDGGYWYRSLRHPVGFAPAIHALVEQGHHAFVEVSSHPVLTPAVQEIIEEHDDVATVAVPSLRREQDTVERLLSSLAQWHSRGGAVDWHTFFDGTGARRVALPTYAFQHERYWLASAPGTAPAGSQDEIDARFWAAVEREDIDILARTLNLPDGAALAPALPALAQWRKERAKQNAVDAWRYRITWQRLAGTAEQRLTGTWLAVVPAQETDHPVLDVLRDSGAEVIVTAGLAAAVADQEISGVLSLLALDGQAHPDHPALPTGFTGTAALVQAMDDLDLQVPLWTVTRGAVSAANGALADQPVQSLTWGLGLVAALEYPRRWGGLVDLPADLDERALRLLPGVLRGKAGEDQLALRTAGVFGRRLVRAPVGDTPGRHPWTPRGTVLVTGGTGGVGATIARWLATAGAEHIVLASRRGPDADGMAELTAELGERGATATVATCDVADRDALAALIDTMPALTAVVHAAGVGQQTPMADMSLADYEAVLASKVTGATNLDDVLGDRELDAFVLVSSNAGVWGGGGQGGYAAANAYLDALAERRRQRGRTATSVAWGSWGGLGLGAVDGAADRLRQLGLPGMDPDLALSALAQAVEHDETVVSVADVDWARFTPGFTAARPSSLLADLPEAQAALKAAEPAAESTSALAALPAAERDRAALTMVSTEAAAVLGHGDPNSVQPNAAFKEQGFDSMTAVELRNRLMAAAGVRLPTTAVFDYPTPTALARFVLSELTGVDERQTTTAAAVVDDDPIAIVAMSGRFPGGITSPEALWDLVSAGQEKVLEFPTDRGWDTDDLYDPEPGTPGKTYSRKGGFMTGAGDFDPAFFKISPREALAMDPQQRIFLEAAWEVCERAGIDVTTLHGSKTGVFAGGFQTGYGVGADVVEEGVAGYMSQGNLTSVLSGRVSYTFGFEGPAVTVDTACSSSLVALHWACQSLRTGESDLALAGGVSVMAQPAAFVEFSRQRGLAVDGRCKAFAAGADGTGWSEGVSVLLVERLSDARRNGHDVLAIVRGSAINQDGASNGLTAPNGPSQQRVIRQALANAGLSADDVDAVEAHGTGTTLGDPIEAQALLSTYGRDRTVAEPLWLGSLKSNIGHTQAAAGVAGVIKMVQAMEHGQLPKTLHVDEPTPHVDWSDGGVELLTNARDWPAVDRPRRFGVSAFGVSGTNAHVIVEQPPAVEPVDVERRDLPAVPWVLSARTPTALRGQAERLLPVTPQHDEVDVAYSLATTRAALEYRAVVIDDLLAATRAVAAGEDADNVVTGLADVTGRTVFVFPGQGTQWVGMGAHLLDTCPVFAESMAECATALSEFVDWSLLDVIRGGSLDRVDVVQPAA